MSASERMNGQQCDARGGIDENGEQTSGRSLNQEQRRVIERVRASSPMQLWPRAIERMRWYDWVGVALMIVFVIAILYQLLAQPLPSGWSIGMSAVLSVAVFAGVASARLARRRSAAIIRAHKGFLCPHCHYALGGCPDEGSCPECGTLYRRDELVRMWKSAYGLNDQFPRTADEASKER